MLMARFLPARQRPETLSDALRFRFFSFNAYNRYSIKENAEFVKGFGYKIRAVTGNKSRFAPNENHLMVTPPKKQLPVTYTVTVFSFLCFVLFLTPPNKEKVFTFTLTFSGICSSVPPNTVISLTAQV